MIRQFWIGLVVLVSLAACGDDGEEATTSTPVAGKGYLEPCSADAECQVGAICREGGVCTDPLGPTAFVEECSDANACAGGTCINLVDNVQGKEGICSMPCGDDPSDCGTAGVCVELAGRMLCLKPCSTNEDCDNGFACVEDPMGAGSACLAEPT